MVSSSGKQQGESTRTAQARGTSAPHAHAATPRKHARRCSLGRPRCHSGVARRRRGQRQRNARATCEGRSSPHTCVRGRRSGTQEQWSPNARFPPLHARTSVALIVRGHATSSLCSRVRLDAALRNGRAKAKQSAERGVGESLDSAVARTFPRSHRGCTVSSSLCCCCALSAADLPRPHSLARCRWPPAPTVREPARTGRQQVSAKCTARR